MKAALCKTFGSSDAISIEDIAEPTPGPGEVVLNVAAASLNFADTLMMRDAYQFKPPMPFSPGAEVAGTIEALGVDVQGFALGDRVLAYTRYNGCREKTLVNASALIPIPDNVSDDIASGISVTYGTAIHGLKDRGQLQSGETLAVLGASGGAGLAAVEIGKRMGARVIAVVSTQEKGEACQQHGADEILISDASNLKEKLKDLTGGKGGNGVDIVYDCVGGDLTEQALRACAWEARFLIVGFASGDIPKVPANLLLLKGCQMLGVFWTSFMERNPEKHRTNIEQVLGWCAQGHISPRIHATFPLEETAQGLSILENRQAIGKLVVRP